MENRIILIVSFHNVESYIIECLDSICKQKYDNWICVMLDNNSTDNTKNIINNYIEKSPFKDKLKYNRFVERKSPLYCDIFLMENYLEDNDICAIISGDDKLIGPYALDIINNIYLDNPNVLLTHGTYENSDGIIPIEQVPYKKIRFDNIRRLGSNINKPHEYHPAFEHFGFDYNCSHLKTFKGIIFKELQKQDPIYDCFKIDDKWINYYADVFYMTPLMEIAGFENIYFNEIPIYWYRLHDNNEHNNRPDFDLRILYYKKKFKQLNA